MEGTGSFEEISKPLCGKENIQALKCHLDSKKWMDRQAAYRELTSMLSKAECQIPIFQDLDPPLVEELQSHLYNAANDCNASANESAMEMIEAWLVKWCEYNSLHLL